MGLPCLAAHQETRFSAAVALPGCDAAPRSRPRDHRAPRGELSAAVFPFYGPDIVAQHSALRPTPRPPVHFSGSAAELSVPSSSAPGRPVGRYSSRRSYLSDVRRGRQQMRSRELTRSRTGPARAEATLAADLLPLGRVTRCPRRGLPRVPSRTYRGHPILHRGCTPLHCQARRKCS